MHARQISVDMFLAVMYDIQLLNHYNDGHVKPHL